MWIPGTFTTDTDSRKFSSREEERRVIRTDSRTASACMDTLKGWQWIAALYVSSDGPYADLPGVEMWDSARDARTYSGPHPVVAHPPCERWGRYWHGGPSARVRRVKGDDGGCFAAALESVRRFGGVLEHPEGSCAWVAFGLKKPPVSGGWILADWEGGWTCCVEQGHYGHRARKRTWLYACRVNLPSLAWGKSSATVRMEDSYHSADERRRLHPFRMYLGPRLSDRERWETPIQFRDLLLSIAGSVRLEATA
jgi:hypothetical protein